MFELITGCPDYNTPMIHNLKPHIPFDNLLIIMLHLKARMGKQGLHSGERTHLQPMWLGFNSRY